MYSWVIFLTSYIGTVNIFRLKTFNENYYYICYTDFSLNTKFITKVGDILIWRVSTTKLIVALPLILRFNTTAFNEYKYSIIIK